MKRLILLVAFGCFLRALPALAAPPDEAAARAEEQRQRAIEERRAAYTRDLGKLQEELASREQWESAVLVKTERERVLAGEAPMDLPEQGTPPRMRMLQRNYLNDLKRMGAESGAPAEPARAQAPAPAKPAAREPLAGPATARKPPEDTSAAVMKQTGGLVYQPEGSRHFAFRQVIELPAGGVWHTDGQASSEDVVEAYLLPSAQPGRPDYPAQASRPPEKLSYQLLAVRRQQAGALTLPIRNAHTDERMRISWDTSAAQPGGKDVMDGLKRARTIAWLPYAVSCEGPVAQAWVAAQGGSHFAPGIGRPARRETTGLSAFNLLGGRAAVDETLQMQVLGEPAAAPPGADVPVDSIPGVQVKSHPYEQMLGSDPGGQLLLAALAPPDRFFVHIATPKAIMPFLDDGAAFLSKLGASLAGHSIEYRLTPRYLARLGLDEAWLRKFLASGAVQECALILPDLFLIDGTDLTVVSRVVNPQLLGTLLKLVGVADLSGGQPVVRELGNGGKAHWAMRGNLLFVSTSASELEAALALDASGGEGSLAKSAEFRYMLSKLPADETTRIYAYLSDPFIRRLVGPRAKIGQLRRVKARADMEHLTAVALLARLDGIEDATSVSALAQRGYLPELYLDGAYSLDGDLVAHSTTYGALPRMKTLTEAPVEMATPAEAASYKLYVDNYSRYWSRYFDPIAMRLNDTPDGGFEATTFILPLIDNSIYDAVRESLASGDAGVPLKAPVLSPEPIIAFSLNLREDLWQKVPEGLSEMFRNSGYPGAVGRVALGPSVHLAIHDADPVIALGSGDILGAFGADIGMLGAQGGLFVPVLLSVLTRPCTLMIESEDPEGARRFLLQTLQMAVSAFGGQAGFGIDVYDTEGQDASVVAFSMGGVFKMRFGIEARDGFIMIRNIPWANRSALARLDTAPLAGALLRVSPAACDAQLAGLHASAHDRYRTAAMKGLGYLYPLVASGYAAPDDAAAQHEKLFGFRPVHPGTGSWTWEDGQAVSTAYGSVHRQRQPAHHAGDADFGVFKDIRDMSLNMQLEDSGLRAAFKWRLRAR